MKGKIEWAVYLGGDEAGKKEELGKGGKESIRWSKSMCLELFGGMCLGSLFMTSPICGKQHICCCCGHAGVWLTSAVEATGMLSLMPVRDLPEERAGLPNKTLVNSLISKLWRFVVLVSTASQLGKGKAQIRLGWQKDFSLDSTVSCVSNRCVPTGQSVHSTGTQLNSSY